MAQVLVPDKVWLVCSKGMSSQQMSVTSQQSVKMMGGKLVATEKDGPGKNFNCAAMVLAGAVIGAMIVGIVAAATVATGGVAGAAIVGACAAGGAVGGGILGFGAGFIPGICKHFLTGWEPVHPQIVIGPNKYHPILADSIVPCSLPGGGGVVSIYYSKEAADAAINYTRWNTGLTLLEITFGSFASGFLGSLVCGGAGTGAFRRFGRPAFFNIFKRSAFPMIINAELSVAVTDAKAWLYKQAGLDDDVYMGNTTSYDIKKGTERNDDTALSEISKGKTRLDRVGGTASSASATNSRPIEKATITNVYGLGTSWEAHTGTLSNQGGEGAIPMRKPVSTSDVFETVYSRVEPGYGNVSEANYIHTEHSNEYFRSGDKRATNNHVKEGAKGLGADIAAGLITDFLTAVINNKILKDQIQDMVDSMIKERAARKKIQVQENEV